MHHHHHQRAESKVLALIRQISSRWSGRAQLRLCTLQDEFTFFPERDDFLEELIPFWGHPGLDALRSNKEARATLLSIGWLVYNHKTIAIENRIVSPVCVELLESGLGELPDHLMHLISEILTDEAFHTLLAVHSCNLACTNRGLHAVHPQYALVRGLNEQLAQLDSPRDKLIARLATATVSELFVSGYLSRLSNAPNVQPLFVRAVATHRQDELMHGNVFGLIVEYLCKRMTDEELRLFCDVCASAIVWFEDQELGCWKALTQLNHIEIPESTYSETAVREDPPPTKSNYSSLFQLLERLNLVAEFEQAIGKHKVVFS